MTVLDNFTHINNALDERKIQMKDRVYDWSLTTDLSVLLTRTPHFWNCNRPLACPPRGGGSQTRYSPGLPVNEYFVLVYYYGSYRAWTGKESSKCHNNGLVTINNVSRISRILVTCLHSPPLSLSLSLSIYLSIYLSLKCTLSDDSPFEARFPILLSRGHVHPVPRQR